MQLFFRPIEKKFEGEGILPHGNFNNTEEWYNAIPEDFRPHKDQPFYHVFAENKEIFYIAYVSEQNLLDDLEGGPANHPDIKKIFSHFDGKCYIPHNVATN